MISVLDFWIYFKNRIKLNEVIYFIVYFLKYENLKVSIIFLFWRRRRNGFY